MKCEAACNTRNVGCSGEVSRVRVIARDGRDWGEFWYCSTAIADDTDAGFAVRLVEESEEVSDG